MSALWYLDCDRIFGSADETTSEYDPYYQPPSSSNYDERNYQSQKATEYWMGTAEEWAAEGFDISNEEHRDLIMQYNGEGWPNGKTPVHLKLLREKNIAEKEALDLLEEGKLRTKFPDFYKSLDRINELDPVNYDEPLSQRDFTFAKYQFAEDLAESTLVESGKDKSDPFVECVGATYRSNINTILVCYLVRYPDGTLDYPRFFKKVDTRYDYGIDLDVVYKEERIRSSELDDACFSIENFIPPGGDPGGELGCDFGEGLGLVVYYTKGTDA